jgi:hypothetical protein
MQDVYVCTYTRFFYTYMDIYAYMYIYLYVVKNFVSFRFAKYFDKTSPKRNETWPGQNEISEKFCFVTKQKKSISGKPYRRGNKGPLRALE